MRAKVDDPKFEWDKGNVGHLARHNVSQSEAQDAILDTDAIMLEIQTGEEERLQAVGATGAGRIIAVVFTLRDEVIRPITAYDAPVRMQQIYLRGGLT